MKLEIENDKNLEEIKTKITYHKSQLIQYEGMLKMLNVLNSN